MIMQFRNLILVLSILGGLFIDTLAVTPMGEITTRKVLGTITVIYGAPGSFGSTLSLEKDAVFIRLVKPTSGFDGCGPVAPSIRNNMGFYLFVSRGNCSFLDKAIAASNVGASGVVVFNSIEGIYQGNNYASSDDYDCDNGSGYVDTVLSPVYSDEMTALMPSSCTGDSKCSSGRCVLTNVTSTELGSQVCCAWDLYTTMAASDSDTSDSEPSIPAMFVRMEDADTINGFDELDKLTLEVAMFQRPSSVIDFASILVWLIAVMTAVAGATMAAEEDKLHQQGSLFKTQKPYGEQEPYHDPIEGHESRESFTDLLREESVGASGDVNEGPGSLIEVEAARDIPSLGSGVIEDHYSFSPFKSLFTSSASTESSSTAINCAPSSSNGVNSWRHLDNSNINNSNTSRDNSYNSTRSGVSRRHEIDRERRLRQHSSASKSYSPQGLSENEDVEADALQITSAHAVGFILLSSTFLLVMYFVDIYSFVSLLYLLSAGFASSKVFFYPFFTRLVRTYTAIRTDVEIDEVPDHGGVGEICGIDLPMVLSGCVSLGLCVTWYLFSEDVSWVWLLQDFLGVSVCILFLSSVHLPNLQAATMLLGLAFCYDVFFVFISPYVFGSSVMVTVATGSATTAHSDANYCEKYPTDSDCDVNTLPMLLIVPTFSSYLSSESMLGLGDIVLPGLLLVWAARLDIRRYGSLSSPYASRGDFPMVVFGYAVGLMVANFAVAYFETGQPALLYIVPLTLLPVLFRSFRAETLPELWRGLPRMKTIAQPFDRAEQEALLAGRASLLLAEATWGEKAADVSVDYLAYSQSAEGASVPCEPYDSAAVAVLTKSGRTSPPSGFFNENNRRYGTRNSRRRDDGLI